MQVASDCCVTTQECLARYSRREHHSHEMNEPIVARKDCRSNIKPGTLFKFCLMALMHLWCTGAATDGQAFGSRAELTGAAHLNCQVQALWHVWRRKICQVALTGREQLAETCADPAVLTGSWPGHGVVDSWKL